MKRLILLALFLSSTLWAQSPQESYFLKGLQTSEELFDFLASHPCEIGLDRSCDKPLRARDLLRLKSLLRNLEEWRLLAFDGFVPMSHLDVSLPFEIARGSFSIVEKKRFNWERLQTESWQLVTLGDDQASQEFITQTQMGVAVNLVLYDSFFRLIEILSQAKKLRSILERDLPFEGALLSKTLSLAMDEARWEKTHHSIALLGSLAVRERSVFTDYGLKSLTAQQMKEGRLDARMRKVMFVKGQLQQSEFFEKIYRLTGVISKLFGNTAGLFQLREGKLKRLPASDLQEIRLQLKPLSLLLEKTPFRLTDKFIPGYFGHVAIWLGAPKDLMALKIIHQGRVIDFLSHPDVTPHLEKLSQGKLVLEALRIPGVTVNTLEHFMDIDDLVVLEAPEMSEEKRAELLLRAFQQIGKPYDFNFNVESESEIVCSELVYTVYQNMEWPTDRSLGRYTISPDHVAWRAVEECFELKALYLEGQKISHNLPGALKKALESKQGLDYRSRGGCGP